MNNIGAIISGLDKLADTLAAESVPGKEVAVKFFRQAAYALRTTLGSAKVWYAPADCTDTIASAGTSVSHLWDSVEAFFDEADWVEYGQAVKINRSVDVSPIFAVLVPTALNENGTVLQSEVRVFGTLQEAVAAGVEAMKEIDQ